MERVIDVGLVQMHSGNNVDQNIGKALQRIQQAASKGAQIVCLPELFNAPYFCQERDDRYFDLAEPVPGSTTEILSNEARKWGVTVITSIFEKAEKYYNTAVILNSDGKLAGKYRKVHIPDDPANHYDEAYYFSSGDLGFPVFHTPLATIGALICFDQWFPEAARLEVSQGAEILFYPTAIGWPITQTREELNRAENEMWKTIQISHGIANNCFVVSVNRVGKQDTLNFWGSSFVSDPYGRILTMAPTDAEVTLVARCDFSVIDQKKKDWPFLDARRIKYEQQ